MSAPAAAAADGAVRLLAFAQINASRLNPRKTFDAESLAELAESIAANGVLQNLVVRPSQDWPGEFEIVAGERRWRAIGRLIEEERWDRDAAAIPCRVIEADEGEALALALLENLQRQDVNPMEEAEAFARLHAADPERWSTRTIAERIGKTQRHVQLRLALAGKLAEPVREALRAGEIPLAHARAMVGAPAKAQEAALEAVREGSWQARTADALREFVWSHLIPVDRAFFPLDTYPGEIVESDDGRRWFADREAFAAHQREAAEAKVAELRQHWAWAELKEGLFWRVDYATSKNKAVAGAVVHLDRELRVHVHTGLVKPRPVDDEAKRTDWEARQAERDRRGLAIDAFQEALCTALAAPERTDLALRLLAFALLSEDAPLDLFGYDGIGARIRKALDLPADAETDSARIWEAITAVGRADLLPELLALIAADRVTAGNPYDDEPDPTVVALADACGIALPEHWQPQANAVRDADPAEADDEDDFGTPGVCRLCGCTEDHACETIAGPCHWLEPDLCSACADGEPARPPATETETAGQEA